MTQLTPSTGLDINPPEKKEEAKPKPPKKAQQFLEDKQREDLRAQLKTWGVDVGEDASDMDLVKAVQGYARDLNKVTVGKQSADLQSKLDVYAQGSYLTDRKFIAQLYQLNVPQIYIRPSHEHPTPLFKNEDAALIKVKADGTLDGTQIWKKISRSGINIYPDLASIYRNSIRNHR